MNDLEIGRLPPALATIKAESEALGFSMASESKTGALLRALAAAKPGGKFLELGTGTGLGTSWLLAGMDASARLTSVDNDVSALAIAQRQLGDDPRVTFHLADGAEFLGTLPPAEFDFIYADTWAGKFTHLDEALGLLRVGGVYFIDDLSPQPNWPEEHAPKVPRLIAELERRSEFTTVKLDWASGLMLVVRNATAPSHG